MSVKQKNQFNFKEGEVLLVDKPLEWTSFDVVNKIRSTLRKILQTKKIKVGHAGTLDPLASGLLIVCTGKATKKIQAIQDQEKEYEGTFFIGATTPSYDRETEVDQEFPVDHITDELIKATTQQFTGDINQVPPVFSAIKREGEALYKKARKGIKVEAPPRQVTISSFEILDIQIPLVKFKVVCSKGTYIRSLAYDFGKVLNNGAYLHDLRRTRIGDYNVEDAWEIQNLVAFLNKNNAVILK